MKTIESLKPKIIFPMHDRKQEGNYKQFASDLRERGVTQPVICPERRGDRFVWGGGAIK
jgi:hypothetical protein